MCPACLFVLNKEEIGWNDRLERIKSVTEEFRNKGKGYDAIQKYPHPIQRSFSLTPEGLLSPSSPESLEARTQDLPAKYHDAGQFYFAKSSTWLSNKSVLATAYGFLIPKYSAVDIDDMEDLEYLRRLYK